MIVQSHVMSQLNAQNLIVFAPASAPASAPAPEFAPVSAPAPKFAPASAPGPRKVSRAGIFP